MTAPSRADAGGHAATPRSVGLDLVRAVAITGVLGAHVGGSVMQAYGIHGLPFVLLLEGGNGVELFFGLSGFLIGGLLLDIVERDPGPRAWLVFMTRRWLRTLPLYVLTVMVLLATVTPERPIAHAGRYLTVTQNLAWPMPADGWFGISWSLTVEEWFYLSFSALLLALAAVLPRRALAATCAVFVVLPLAARLVLMPPPAEWDAAMRKVVVYRLDAIAYGVVMAGLCRRRPAVMRRWRFPLLLAAVAVFVLAELDAGAALLGAAWRPVYLSLVPLACVLVLPSALDLRVSSRWARAVIRWLSERSYALYLVHLSLLDVALRVVADGRLSRAWLGPAVAAAAALVAEASYRWLESPILRRRPAQFGPVDDGLSRSRPPRSPRRDARPSRNSRRRRSGA